MWFLLSGVANKQVLISNQGPYRLANKSRNVQVNKQSLLLKQICSVYAVHKEIRRIGSLTISKMRAALFILWLAAYNIHLLTIESQDR